MLQRPEDKGAIPKKKRSMTSTSTQTSAPQSRDKPLNNPSHARAIIPKELWMSSGHVDPVVNVVTYKKPLDHNHAGQINQIDAVVDLLKMPSLIEIAAMNEKKERDAELKKIVVAEGKEDIEKKDEFVAFFAFDQELKVNVQVLLRDLVKWYKGSHYQMYEHYSSEMYVFVRCNDDNELEEFIFNLTGKLTCMLFKN